MDFWGFPRSWYSSWVSSPSRGPRSPHILESGFRQPPVLPPENWRFFVNYMFIPSIDSTVWGWKLKYRIFYTFSAND
jgi:hypothetical protein